MSFTIPPFEKRLNTAYHKDSTSDEYFGWADRGALTSEAKWSIMKIDYTGNNWIAKWPNGDDRFRYIWDNVETYTYQSLKSLKDYT